MLKYLRYLKILYRISIFKTLWFNFRAFRIKDALKMPVLIGRGTILRNIGEIEISGKIRCALVTIGIMYIHNDHRFARIIWNNKGSIEIGGKVQIRTGTCICVGRKGKLHFGGINTLGFNSMIYAEKDIYIGENVGISWHVQIIDTDFHYMENVDTGEIKPKNAPVIIHDDVWIGNHASISKGVELAQGCIVASYSVVTKSCLEPYTLMAGVPATCKRKGLREIRDFARQLELDEYFNSKK